MIRKVFSELDSARFRSRVRGVLIVSLLAPGVSAIDDQTDDGNERDHSYRDNDQDLATVVALVQ